MKAIRFMITLLLKNPSKYSNANDHLKALEKRIRLWGKVYTNKLVNECNTMQGRLTFYLNPNC